MPAFSAGQRFLARLLPRGCFDSLEAGTRRYALECPCGEVRDLWEAGGAKYEGNEQRTLSRCPACGERTWHHKRRKTYGERRRDMERLAERGEDRVFLAAAAWWFSALTWGVAAIVWMIPAFMPGLAGEPVHFALLWLFTFVLGWMAGPWFWFTTRYRITHTHLVLHSGPLHTALALARISEVSRSRGGIGLSFAIHTDCFWVGYPDSRLGGVFISPKERTLFIAELDKVCPQLMERSGELATRPPT